MPRYQACKHPLLLMNMLSTVVLMVADPEIIQEMWSNKVKFFNKHSIAEDLNGPIMRKHFVMLPTGDQWRTERKALSQMFYKEKLRIMIGVVKQHTELQYAKWIEGIEKNGEHRIDIG